MANSPATERLLTAEDLYGLPDDDQDYELVEGRLVVSEPPGWTHGDIAASIAAALVPFVRAHGLGRVVVESGYVLARRPDTVRGPDVSFVRADRLPAADVAHRFYEGAPDLAIEIVSPDDRAAEVARTVQGYLRAGTRAVWVVYPDTRSIVVHGPDGLARLHGPDDAIDGGDVLPGFSAPVAELLPE
jgi:Uma2 family endonuclease